MRDLYTRSHDFLLDNKPDIKPWPANLRYANHMRYQVKTKVPAVRVKCFPQPAQDVWASNLTLGFPSLAEDTVYWKRRYQPAYGDVPAPPVISLTVATQVRQHLARRGIQNADLSHGNLSGLFSASRPTIAIPLDTWDQTSDSINILVLFHSVENWIPSHEVQPMLTNILLCSVDARWTGGATILDAIRDTQLPYEFVWGRMGNSVTTLLHPDHAAQFGRINFEPLTDGSMPQIRLRPSWFDQISAPLPQEVLLKADGSDELFSRKVTALEKLLPDGYPYTIREDISYSRPRDVESAIATMLADALSRNGIKLQRSMSAILEQAWPTGQLHLNTEALARTMFRQGEP